jgi:hypothetical protein
VVHVQTKQLPKAMVKCPHCHWACVIAFPASHPGRQILCISASKRAPGVTARTQKLCCMEVISWESRLHVLCLARSPISPTFCIAMFEYCMRNVTATPKRTLSVSDVASCCPYCTARHHLCDVRIYFWSSNDGRQRILRSYDLLSLGSIVIAIVITRR